MATDAIVRELAQLVERLAEHLEDEHDYCAEPGEIRTAANVLVERIETEATTPGRSLPTYDDAKHRLDDILIKAMPFAPAGEIATLVDAIMVAIREPKEDPK